MTVQRHPELFIWPAAVLDLERRLRCVERLIRCPRTEPGLRDRLAAKRRLLIAGIEEAKLPATQAEGLVWHTATTISKRLAELEAKLAPAQQAIDLEALMPWIRWLTVDRRGRRTRLRG